MPPRITNTINQTKAHTVNMKIAEKPQVGKRHSFI